MAACVHAVLCRKIAVMSSGLMFVQMVFLVGVFWGKLVTGGNFAFIYRGWA